MNKLQTGFQYLTEEALSIVAALYLWAGRKPQAAIQQSVEAHLPSFLTGKAAIYQTLNQFSSTLTQGFKAPNMHLSSAQSLVFALARIPAIQLLGFIEGFYERINEASPSAKQSLSSASKAIDNATSSLSQTAEKLINGEVSLLGKAKGTVGSLTGKQSKSIREKLSTTYIAKNDIITARELASQGRIGELAAISYELLDKIVLMSTAYIEAHAIRLGNHAGRFVADALVNHIYSGNLSQSHQQAFNTLLSSTSAVIDLATKYIRLLTFSRIITNTLVGCASGFVSGLNGNPAEINNYYEAWQKKMAEGYAYHQASFNQAVQAASQGTSLLDTAGSTELARYLAVRTGAYSGSMAYLTQSVDLMVRSLQAFEGALVPIAFDFARRLGNAARTNFHYLSQGREEEFFDALTGEAEAITREIENSIDLTEQAFRERVEEIEPIFYDTVEVPELDGRESETKSTQSPDLQPITKQLPPELLAEIRAKVGKIEESASPTPTKANKTPDISETEKHNPDKSR